MSYVFQDSLERVQKCIQHFFHKGQIKFLGGGAYAPEGSEENSALGA